MPDTTTLTPAADATATLPLSSTQPDTIGPYRLIGPLGKGGMGVVHRAVHTVTGRTVALKVVDLSGSQLKGHLEQVTHEAMAMASLRHPNVITCYSFGEDGHHLYLALELIPGGDTTGLVARSGGRLDEATIRRLAGQCANGLAAIHRAGLVHRDIKPANILLDEHGDAKLADFGLAWFFRSPTTAAASGEAAMMPEGGTPAYMPPEAVSGGCTPDIRGDIYSLGATMYYWATGRPPFAAGNTYATLQRVLAGNATDLAHLRPDLSRDLVTIIATAMQGDRERRYQDPLALLRALRGDAQDTITAPSPVAPVEEPRPARPRGRTWPLIAAAGVLGALALIVPAARPSPAEPTRAALIAHAPAPGTSGPLRGIQEDGYRLAWLGDPLVRFHEHGSVTYTHAGERLLLTAGAWLDGTPAPALVAALGGGGDFSLELVIRPADLMQEGPARILSVGITPRAANLMLGQSGSRLEMRVRTTATNPDGTRPHLVSTDGVLDGRAQHVAFVRRGRQHLLYVDGRVCCQEEIDGQLNWDADHPWCIGNDHRGGFPWSGSCERLVLAARAWSDQEVAERHRAWSGQAGDAPAR